MMTVVYNMILFKDKKKINIHFIFKHIPFENIVRFL